MPKQRVLSYWKSRYFCHIAAAQQSNPYSDSYSAPASPRGTLRHLPPTRTDLEHLKCQGGSFKDTNSGSHSHGSEVQTDGPGKMPHPKDLVCSYLYTKTRQNKQTNPPKKSNTQTTKCSVKGNNSYNSISAKQLLERHVQAKGPPRTGSAKPSLLHSHPAKPPVHSGGEGRASRARGSPKWHRGVVSSCLYLRVCIGKRDTNLKKGIPASTSLLPRPRFHQR